MKLDLGSGLQKHDGFVTIDYDPLNKPDYVVDLETEPLPFEDNSVDEVIAHHIFEHLGHPGFFNCVKELYRVCKDGAIIDIRVPHHRHDNFFNDSTHRRPITVDGMKLFSKRWNDLCTERGSGDSRLGYLFNVDFSVVSFDFVFSEEARPLLVDMTPEKEQQIQHIIMTQNNIIAETHIVWMAEKPSDAA